MFDLFSQHNHLDTVLVMTGFHMKKIVTILKGFLVHMAKLNLIVQIKVI